MGRRIVSTSLRDQIVQAIQDAIITNELAAGQDIQVDRLASRYGVSATPVREALAVLEGAGLVKIVPNKGAQVTEIHPDDVSNVWEMRRLLEPYAAEIAAIHCTEEEVQRIEKALLEVRAAPDRFDAYVASDVWLHDLLVNTLTTVFHETMGRSKVHGAHQLLRTVGVAQERCCMRLQGRRCACFGQ